MKDILELILAILATLVFLSGCNAEEKMEQIQMQETTQNQTYYDSQNQPRDPQVITPQQAEEMMTQPGVIILDVRTQDEFDSGHIENAILLPYNEITTRASTILTDKNQTILIYCRSGRRSNIAAWALAELGFTAVYDFGGILSWHGEITTPGNSP